MSRRAKPLVITPRLSATRALAVQLMTRHKLYGWEFAFNQNVHRAGVCRYPADDIPGRIELSVHFIELNDYEEVRDTILHEIAHALVGEDHGHDEVWKAKCREIGAKPERCFGEEVRMPKGRWRAKCPSCSREYTRHRRPRQLVGWHCRPCGPRNGQICWRPTG
jgi:predicted SprT family Zn-dependent metalloprotease